MFTDGSKNLLLLLGSGGRFPPTWQVSDGRIGPSETLHAWFKRIVDQHLNRQPEACQVEDNLAFFCVVARKGAQVTYINAQALVTLDGPLEEFYRGHAGVSAQYFRLDFDPTCLGPLYKEPLPHVHTIPAGEPRMYLGGLGHDGVLVEFLDLLYRNYFYDAWAEWAERVWSKYRKPRSMPDNLPAIREAFASGQHAILRQDYRNDLMHLKRALFDEHVAVARRSKLEVSPDRHLLSYGPPFK